MIEKYHQIQNICELHENKTFIFYPYQKLKYIINFLILLIHNL